jgi:secreted trypsin-like serine protease
MRVLPLLALLLGCAVPPGAEIGATDLEGELGFCGFRAVGYGKSEFVDFGERKSAGMCIIAADHENGGMLVRPSGAQSCSGDSGGPLFLEGTNQVVGVLSGGFNSRCTAESKGQIFGSIEDNREFILKTLTANPFRRTK